jgi:cholesterol transport system auxiliary component
VSHAKGAGAAGRCAVIVAMIIATGCDALRPPAVPQTATYALDAATMDARADARERSPAPAAGPTLLVNPPHAAAGFDSRGIVYLPVPHRYEAYAYSAWIDTPARMLAPLIVAAVQDGGTFRAVVLTPSAAAGDLRLDTEIVRLQQDFGSTPSRVRFTLRATVVDDATHRVLASRELDASEAAATEDAYGGVLAANRAVRSVLQALAGLCAEAADRWEHAAARAAVATPEPADGRRPPPQ